MDKTNKVDTLRSKLRTLSWPIEHRERGSVTIRANSNGRTLEMFIPFQSESVDMGFRERIDPGAFSRSIRSGKNSQRNDIFALWSHDARQPLARQAYGTLDFEERNDGLVAVATLDPAIDFHQRALQLVGRNLVRGTSFGFEAVRDDWDESGDEPVRTLLEVKLHEVSPVVFPAYQDSDIEARSRQIKHTTGLDAEDLLGILQASRDGKAPLERRSALLSFISKLQGYVPDEPVAPAPDDRWHKRAEAHERFLRLGKVA